MLTDSTGNHLNALEPALSPPMLEVMDFTDSSNSNSNESDVGGRTLKNVEDMLTKATIDKNEIKPLAQSIFLSKNITSDEYKLLELDEDKLNYLLEGKRLVIRGIENENAVCCTQNTTSSFKIAEISNPLLVSPNIVEPDKIDPNRVKSKIQRTNIEFMTNSYFVMEKERPKMSKLKNLLEMNLFSGIAYDNNSDAKNYTINDLLSVVQASEEEIYDYLNYIEAYQINGYWRLLDAKFQNDLVEQTVNLIEEKSWSPKKIPINEFYDDLKHIFTLSILKQFVNYYFTKDPNDKQHYELRADKICRFFSESLLRQATKMRFTSEFLPLLKRVMPGFFDTEFDIKPIIQSLGYYEEPFIYYLNVLDLPDDLERRFKYLFEIRKKWPDDELRPFIRDLCSNENTEINNALVKYCRQCNVNGMKYFTSRL